MNPIPLPTNNLYKFCAIAGITLILVSLYGSWKVTHELFTLENEQALALEKGRVEAEWSSREADVLKRSYADLLWNQQQSSNPTDKPPENVLRVPLSPTEFSRQLDAGLATAKQISLNVKTIESRRREIDFLANERFLVRWVTAAGILLGIWLSVYGFRNWRTLQLHQDKMLLAQKLHLSERLTPSPPA
ncbi:MAG: hypothetical protein QOD99_2918 [Chthoniobacter sp.]|nr:hypothetical protein [Chthoniobacter sp.]